MNREVSSKRKRVAEDDVSEADLEESEDEFAWENVDLNDVGTTAEKASEDKLCNEVNIRLNEVIQSTVARGRPRTSAIDRKIRLEIHKLHLLCLLFHGGLRNRWTQDTRISKSLQSLKANFKHNVHPKVTSAQLQRTRVLLEGLHAASDLWSQSYRITEKGISKAKWYTEEDLQKVVTFAASVGREESLDDLLSAAETMEGSRDTGAQLFVAFLRSLGLETRLVCSLQPLSLNLGKGNMATFTELPTKAVAIVPAVTAAAAPTPKRGKMLSRPSLRPLARRPVANTPTKQLKVVAPLIECPYPVYWAEVFDPAAQKWYALDPLVTGTVNKPSHFEPPQSESENSLRYVIGFRSDGSAKDITHRYTKQFNAKIRKARLESIPSGHIWWSKLMKLYKSRQYATEDAIENSEFAQRELNEGIPANVSDLKSHPLFVIERHLRKDEVISPLRPCGTITVGNTRPAVVENVFPRKFVIRLRSSLAWYMRGRAIKVGEQPMKHKTREMKETEHISTEDDAYEGYNNEGLYAESQTETYVPPAIINGLVPKNKYGNIDIFMPSMLPGGGHHFNSRDGEKIAQLLGIDYAAAITGFDHSNRTTVPVKQGVVVAAEFVVAIQAVQQAVLEEAEESIQQAKTLAALTRWSRFMRTLRIRSHVQARYGQDDAAMLEADVEQSSSRKGTEELFDSHGGF